MGRFAAVFALVVVGCGRYNFDERAIDGSAPVEVAPPSCGARTVELVPPSGVVTGTYADLLDDAAGTCGGGGFADAVYAIDVPSNRASLLVAADLDGTTGDSLIHIRRDCADPLSEVICDTDGGRNEDAAWRLLQPGAGRYYAFIDGESTNGAFEALIQVLLAEGDACTPGMGRDVCGAGLECVSGTCTPAACPLMTTQTLAAVGSSFQLTVDTSLGVAHHAASCGPGNDGGGRAREVIIGVQLGVAARIRVTTDDPITNFDTLIYVRAACRGAELACDDDDGGVMNTSVATTPVTPPGLYYVFIDGFSIRDGTAQVTISAE